MSRKRFVTSLSERVLLPVYQKEICYQFIRKRFVTSLSERVLLPVYQKEICYQFIRKRFVTSLSERVLTQEPSETMGGDIYM